MLQSRNKILFIINQKEFSDLKILIYLKIIITKLLSSFMNFEYDIYLINCKKVENNKISRFHFFLEKKLFTNKINDYFFGKEEIAYKKHVVNNIDAKKYSKIISFVPIKLIDLTDEVKKEIIYFSYNDKIVQLSTHFGKKEIEERKEAIIVNVIVEEMCFVNIKLNYHWSILRNTLEVYSLLSDLLVKLVKTDDFHKKQNINDRIETQEFTKVNYYINFYRNIGYKYYSQIINRLFNIYRERWGIVIGKPDLLKGLRFKNSDIKLEKKEFWADPFLIKKASSFYLFFERFPFSEKKGLISCCKIEGNKVSEAKDVLNEKNHLSYPMLFEDNKDLYMIPEMSVAKCLKVYKCVDFPLKWIQVSESFNGYSLADSNMLIDNNGIYWLFATQKSGFWDDHCTELCIWQIEDFPYMKHVIPHKLNPIYIDSTIARNGGGFVKKGDKIYRYAQINNFGKYGNGLVCREIKKLSIEEYQEETVNTIIPENGIVGIHQYSECQELSVIDVCLSR